MWGRIWRFVSSGSFLKKVIRYQELMDEILMWARDSDFTDSEMDDKINKAIYANNQVKRLLKDFK